MGKRHLSTEELKTILGPPVEALEPMQAMAAVIVSETIDRTKQLDSKAASLVTFSSATVALLVAAFSPRASTITLWQWVFIVAAGWAVVYSGLMALLAVRIHECEWFSDADWFGTPALRAEKTRLARLHLIAAHQVRWQHERVNTAKATKLQRAYLCFLLAGALLAVALAIPTLDRLLF